MKVNNIKIVACLILLIMSCKSNAQISNTESAEVMCYVNSPMELAWLQDVIERHKSLNTDRKADIFEYSYEGGKYFEANMCVGCPDFITVVYDCKGEILCQEGGIMGRTDCPDFREEAISKRLIWSSYRQPSDY